TGGVNFARSTNGGLSFTNVAVSPASGATTSDNFPVVATDGSGHLSAVWLEVLSNNRTRVQYNSSNDFGATWGSPTTIVSDGTSVYPWVARQGTKVAVSLYHTSTLGTPDTVSSGAQWFETYLESAYGGTTFSGQTVVDSTPAKTGIVCTSGINCSSGRELGDFQSVTIDNLGRADVTYIRVSGSSVLTMFSRQS